MPYDPSRTLRGGLAGGLAAGVWAAQLPLSRRVFKNSFSDVELLGKLVTRGPGWRLAGWALHLQNGFAFGAVYAHVAPRMPLPAWARGPALALFENFALWPLAAVSDRFHPARDEMSPVFGDMRALAQETWCHLLFGVVLGELERRLHGEGSADTAMAEPHADGASRDYSARFRGQAPAG